MSEEKQACSGDCGSCAHRQEEESCKLKANLARVRHKIVVLSGKGGVGKSTVAVNLAVALALAGRKAGLLDADLHGPSVPRMTAAAASGPVYEDDRILPVETDGIKVMSVGYLLEATDTPVIWRGPMKIGVIRQLLSEVAWGELDCLVVDTPPGTGDEPLSVCQLLAETGADGAVIVTTPQSVAALDVSKSINFCKQLGFPVLGLIENMSGFVCPHCGKETPIFSAGSGEQLAAQYGVKLLGRIPIDPLVCQCGDDGKPFVHFAAKTAAGRAFQGIVDALAID